MNWKSSSTTPLMLESSCQGFSTSSTARPWGSFFRTSSGKRPKLSKHILDLRHRLQASLCSVRLLVALLCLKTVEATGVLTQGSQGAGEWLIFDPGNLSDRMQGQARVGILAKAFGNLAREEIGSIRFYDDSL